MEKKDRAAMRIGGHASRYLAKMRRTGRIVTLFCGGASVLLDEAGEAALLSVHSDSVPLQPWSLQATGLHDLSIDASVLSEGRVIRIGGGEPLDLTKAAIDDLGIEPLAGARLATARDRLRRGLSAAHARQVERLDPSISSLLSAWRETGDDRVLASLIGLGAGSTPAGDDALVGLMAGVALRGEWRIEDSASISQLLCSADLLPRTPIGSAQMIKAACDGAFPEPLCNLAKAIRMGNSDSHAMPAALQRVFNLGATSGVAMVAGLLVAL